jgi:hypothetical protein
MQYLLWDYQCDTSFLFDGYPKIMKIGTSFSLNDLLYVSLTLRLSHGIYTLNHALNTFILSPRAAATKRKTKTMEIDFICCRIAWINLLPLRGYK